MRFSSDLDPARLRPHLSRHGRLHLPGVLSPEDARAVGLALQGDVPWFRSVNVRGKSYDLGLDTLAAMPADRRAELEAAVLEGGRTGFQYDFEAYRLSDMLEAGVRQGGSLSPIEAVYDLLNSDEGMSFIRTLTNEPRCTYADAQATRYRPGSFLTTHDDEAEGKDRLFAYVMNFTPAWRADWGGLLTFLAPDGHVAEAYTPTFNALNIFRVPQPHAVSQVATFAGGDRLSITGWIRARR